MGEWVPPTLEGTYKTLSRVLEGIQIDDWANVTPSRSTAKGDTFYFLNNAQDFLFVSAPLTILGFAFTWFLRKKATC